MANAMSLRPLRIRIVSKVDVPAGVNRALIRLARALSLAGNDVELLYLRGTENQLRAYGVTTRIALIGLKAKLSILLGLPFLRLLLRGGFADENAPDFLGWILLPLLDLKSKPVDLLILGDENLASFSFLAALLTETPYATIVHEARLSTIPILRLLQSAMYSRATAVLCESPLVLTWAKNVLQCPTRLLRMTLPSQDPIYSKKPFVLVDTRWTHKRNPGFIVEILRLVPRVSIVVAGSFSTKKVKEDLLSNLRRSGYENRVRFELGQPDERMADLYRNATAYMRWPERYPDGTLYETGIGWGIVIALENGCPLILDKDLGGSYIIKSGTHGYLVPHSAKAFASAITSLLENPRLTAEMSRNCIELASELSYERDAPELSRFLNGLVCRMGSMN